MSSRRPVKRYVALLNRMMKAYHTADEIRAACQLAISLAPVKYPQDLPTQPKLLGATAWYSFEHNAWPIGEGIRHSFKDHPKLKLDHDVVFAVTEVIEFISLRRGRQSFVMALGFTAASPVASRLARFLRDKDINGHVISTLLKMKVSGFAAEVSPLMDGEQAWIRNLAKRYVLRYPAAA